MSPSISKSTDWAARFLAHDTPVNMVTGQCVTVNLHIENTGSVKWLQNGKNPVHLGYKWYNDHGEQQLDVEDRRTGLPSDLFPGQETSFGAFLVAPPSPGEYTLHWDLIAEGINWFGEAGNLPLVLPVYVSASPRDVTGWRVEAKTSIAQVALALDGDPLTCWNSGTPQSSGQWFRLNLSSPRIVDGLQFLSPGKGFPTGYSLNISADGQTWTAVAGVGSGNAYDVMTVFSPQPMQYAQIDLVTGAPSNWMISEILVHPATAWTASASHNALMANLAIDNRPDTAWTSDIPQSPEMWFQIDLGHAETVSGLALVPSDNGFARSYRIALWNASANRWQVVAEKLNNDQGVDIAFDAIQTQFINVQLLQAAEEPWSIRQVHVEREMERWLRPGE